MELDLTPAATVTGLYRGTFSGLEPLTKDTPLTLDEVRRSPVFYELELNADEEYEDLIIDLIYDNLSPLRLQDLERGTDIPRGVRFWPDGSLPGPWTRRLLSRGSGLFPGWG